MRILVLLTLISALGWSVYWWIGATAKKTALTTWFEQQSAGGWVAEADDLTVTGFPNRFDTIVTGLELADPATGWSWAAPRFNIYALSYQPNRIIAIWPPEQSIATPLERIDITSERLAASVHLEPNTRLGLQESIVEMAGLSLVSTAGWSSAIDSGQLSIRRSPPGTAPDFGYEVDLRADALKLPDPLRNALDPARILPDTVSPIRMRMTPVFSAPWDLPAVEGATPELTQLNIANLSVTWGDLELAVNGVLDVDRLGRAEGEVNVVARNWPDMLNLAVTAGFISEDWSNTLTRGLSVVAETTGETNTLDLPLTFSGGLARFGPIPIGRAPMLVYRQ